MAATTEAPAHEARSHVPAPLSSKSGLPNLGDKGHSTKQRERKASVLSIQSRRKTQTQHLRPLAPHPNTPGYRNIQVQMVLYFKRNSDPLAKYLSPVWERTPLGSSLSEEGPERPGVTVHHSSPGQDFACLTLPGEPEHCFLFMVGQ